MNRLCKRILTVRIRETSLVSDHFSTGNCDKGPIRTFLNITWFNICLNNQNGIRFSAFSSTRQKKARLVNNFVRLDSIGYNIIGVIEILSKELLNPLHWPSSNVENPGLILNFLSEKIRNQQIKGSHNFGLNIAHSTGNWVNLAVIPGALYE